MSTAEDKETTEQDSKKLSDQEVSPIFLFTAHHFPSVLLLSKLHYTLPRTHCLITASSVKLKHLQTSVFALLQLSGFSSCYHCRFFPWQAFSAEPASAPVKAADSEECKASSEEKSGGERDRTESPSTKTEPSATKESTLKQAELSCSQTSPKSE